MQSNGRLQRVLLTRNLAGSTGAAHSRAVTKVDTAQIGDLRLFAMTFAGGFLFTSIFLA